MISVSIQQTVLRQKSYWKDARYVELLIAGKPLSREMHTELHQIGIDRFQEKYKIDLWQEAYYFFINFLVQKGIVE